jgi:hypothetical protein
MKSRKFIAGIALATAMSFGGVAAGSMTASAAPQAAAPATPAITSPIPCTIGGVASTCTLTVTAFQVVNGVLNAVGTITGGGVTIPFQVPVQAPAGACQILDLTLGPLHLDLLGLVVDLNQVHLNITAQPGPGNLLGNLLCAVTHLLDSNGNTGNAVNQLLGLLNRILGSL